MDVTGLLIPKKSLTVTETVNCVSKGRDERFCEDTDIFGPDMVDMIETMVGWLLFHV
jgi:hypothetical protein